MVLRVRMDDLCLDEVLGTLAVSCHLHRKEPADGKENLLKYGVVLVLPGDLGIPGKAVGKEDQGVIRRHVSVDGDHVEGVGDDIREGLLQKVFGDRKVGCEIAEHGAHVGVDHAGALCTAAEGRGLSADLELIGDLLVVGVRRHDCLCRSGAGFERLRLRGGRQTKLSRAGVCNAGVYDDG